MRGISTITSCEVIFAEDPRVTALLLKKLGIENKKYIRFGSEGDKMRLPSLIDKYKENDVAVVVDAGTPGISDPGWVVVHELQKQGIAYTVLPGASALTIIAAASGMVSQQFWFIGFLPIKKGRQTLIEQIAQSPIPVVLYESVHRIRKLLNELMQYCELSRELCIGRELTKLHEDVWRGTISDLANYNLVQKGEFALVIGSKNQ